MGSQSQSLSTKVQQDMQEGKSKTRKVNSFVTFSQCYREKVKNEEPDLTHAQVTKRLGMHLMIDWYNKTVAAGDCRYIEERFAECVLSGFTC